MDLEAINNQLSIKNANTVKEVVLNKLKQDGVITAELYEKYNADYQVIIANPNLFIRWAEKYNIKKTESFYKLVEFKNK
jgi:membrane peptidoglycan carboxypeptidase